MNGVVLDSPRETAVAWVHHRETISQPRLPEKETSQQYAKRLQSFAQYVHDKHDVEGLCRQIHDRAQLVVGGEGAASKSDERSYRETGRPGPKLEASASRAELTQFQSLLTSAAQSEGQLQANDHANK